MWGSFEREISQIQYTTCSSRGMLIEECIEKVLPLDVGWNTIAKLARYISCILIFIALFFFVLACSIILSIFIYIRYGFQRGRMLWGFEVCSRGNSSTDSFT